MGFSSHLNRIALLVALAAIGAVMIWVPAQVVAHYQAIKELDPIWIYGYFALVGTGAALLIGTSGTILYTLWRRSRAKRQLRDDRDRNPSELTRAEQEREYQANVDNIEKFKNDRDLAPDVRKALEPLVAKLEEKREAQRFEIVAFGTISSGKSSLMNALAGDNIFSTELKGGTTTQRQEFAWTSLDRVILVDTPGLGEIDGAAHVAVSAEAARDADLVLLVVDGPLRHSEFQLLEKLAEMEKRIFICLNKIDWLSAREQQELVEQLQEQTTRFIAPDDVLCVRSQATQRTRVRITSTHEEVAEQIAVPADISPLAKRLMSVVKREGAELLMANLLLQSRGLVEEAKSQVQAAVDAKAWQVVDRYTWGAGGAAALSPTPVLDLVAGSAITAKMVVDLATVYKQEIDLQTAVRLLGELGKNLISILGVAAAGPAVTGAVASVLKTVPGAGTLAGGLLQGIVQAVVTRWIGAVFIAYFRDEMRQPLGSLASIARRQWQHVTSLAELQRLVTMARVKFFSGSQE